MLIFPGSAPCDTLSGCIAAADDGDTVRIRTDGPIPYDDWQLYKKNITLEAGAGYDPVVRQDPSEEFNEINITEDDENTPIDVTIRGITFRNLSISTGNNNWNITPGHRILIEDSVITHSWDHNNENALDLTLSEPGRITVRNSRISGTGDPVALRPRSDSGAARFILDGNRISSDPTDLENSSNGVDVDTDGTSRGRVDIRSNSIHGPFQSGGISILGRSGSRLKVNLVGNTIHHTADGAPGIELAPLDPSPASLDVNLRNNIFSKLPGGALSISDDDPNMDVVGSHNALFRAGGSELQGYTLGNPLFEVAPRFVAADDRDLRLKPSSPLIDRGLTCSPGGMSRADAAGKFRLKGRAGDVGAFEFGAGKPPPGKNLFGTPDPDTLRGTRGRDVMCGFRGGDTLRGKGGRDRMYGGGGPDTLRGQGGGDVLVTKDGAGDDRALGGRGNDRCRTDPGDERSSC